MGVILLCTVASAFGQVEQPVPMADIMIDFAACKNDVLAVRALLRTDPHLVSIVDRDRRTPMHYAAAHGAVEVMELLKESGADINAQTVPGVTPIRWAMDFGKYDSFMALVKMGANLELECWDCDDMDRKATHSLGTLHLTTLNYACWKLSEQYILALVDAGANVNSVEPVGKRTPLIWAASNRKSVKVLEALLKRGADIDAAPTTGDTSVMHCFFNGDSLQAKFLLDAGANVLAIGNYNSGWHGNCRMNCAGCAAFSGSAECYKLAISYGSPPRLQDGEGRDPKAIAVDSHHLDLVPLIDQVFARTSQGWTAAHFAVEYGYPEAFEKLKKRGLPLDEPNNSGETPLILAASRGGLVACDSLIHLGVQADHKDGQGENALHKAARLGSSLLVSMLLASGLSPMEKNSQGQTALDLAQNAHADICVKEMNMALQAMSPSLLFKKAAEGKNEVSALMLVESEPSLVNARFGKSWTSLHFAAFYGLVTVLNRLIEKGSSVDARTDSAWTPLMLAVQQNNVVAVTALIKAKANPNARALNGRTALHIAAQENNIKVIPLLIKAGASVADKDSSGLSCLQLAQKLGNTAAVTAMTPKTSSKPKHHG